MKVLTISGKNIKIERGKEGLRVNGTSLEKIVCEQLPPDMENFKDYLADVVINIAIQENGKLITETNYDGGQHEED